ncbi:MAG: DUF6034 family protein [Christensenellaceae bacterium]|jgi:hypothetical protein
MKQRNVFLLVSILFIFLMAACQPTPEKPIVENKSKAADALKDAITEESEIHNDFSDVPILYEKELENKNTNQKVSIQAEIELPEIDKFPIAKLTPTTFTQEEIDAMVYGIMGDDLYAPRDLEKDYSKDEIMQMILDLKPGKNSDLYELDPEAYKDEIQEELSFYEGIYKVAPEKPITRKGNTKKEFFKEENAWRLSVEANLGKDQKANFGYIERETDFLSFGFLNIKKGAIAGGSELTDTDIIGKGVSISLDEAKSVAETTLKNMGLKDYSFAYAGSMPGESGVLDYEEGTTYEDLNKCYVLYYMRNVNGLVENYVNDVYVQEKAQNVGVYNYVWKPEYIRIAVDDNGVLQLDYWNPRADVEIISENVQLKPFSEIQEIFESQVLIEDYAVNWSENPVGTEVYVEKVKLGGMRIIDKNNSGEYLYVPVWDFYGRVITEHKQGTGETGVFDEPNKWTERELGYSLLTINAIDGTIINRAQGY